MLDVPAVHRCQNVTDRHGGLGGAGLGGDLPTGTPDLAPPADQAAAPQSSSLGLPVPGGF